MTGRMPVLRGGIPQLDHLNPGELPFGDRAAANLGSRQGAKPVNAHSNSRCFRKVNVAQWLRQQVEMSCRCRMSL